VDDRRLLAGDEPVRHAGHPDLNPVDAVALALGQRRPHGRDLVGGARRKRDDRLARANRAGCERDSIEDEVGRVAQERLVLVAHRLALDAVPDDDRARVRVGDRAQLARRGEAGAATPGEPRRSRELDQLSGTRTAGGLAGGPVAVEVLRK